jgi:hypothetical protein
LGIADLLHPFDLFAVGQLFRQSDVRHCGVCRGSVPVFLVGPNTDNIAWSDFLRLTTPFLHPPHARRHNERLTQRSFT